MEYNWIYILLSFVLSALSGLIIIPQIMKFCLKRGLFDLPNARKVHHVAVPRLGGTAFIPCMFIAFAASLCVLYCNSGTTQVSISLWTGIFMVSLFMIYVVGTVDDLIGLNAMVKFLVQIAAASLLPLSGLYINDLYGLFGINEIPFWVGAPLTVFIIVFIDNSMNLIDGIDGLAGGLALISLTGFLLCFAREQVCTYSRTYGCAHLLPLLQHLGQTRARSKDIYGRLGLAHVGFHPWIPHGEICHELLGGNALPQ